MRRAGANTLQGYNAQVLANPEQVIVAADLTQSAADAPELAPMVAKATEALGAAGVAEPIGTVLADGGYWSSPQISEIRAKKSR
jgi:hypothetical protein